MILRPYQAEAVNAALSARGRGVLRPLIVLPTGAGKSIVAAEIARRIVSDGGRVLIVTHVAELVEQDSRACIALGLDCGICSAGLDRRDTRNAVVVAGIQSVFRSAQDFGRISALIVDEAHRVPSDSDSMYQQLLTGLRAVNDGIQLIGLTATPYRTGEGTLIDGEAPLFDEISYELPVRQLIEDGTLAKLTSRQAASPDLAGVSRVAGDWSEGALGARLAGSVPATVADLVRRAEGRRSILAFGCTVEHCGQIEAELWKHGVHAATITGATHAALRARLIDDFRRGALRCLVNCQVLTTGFDAPGVDCLAIVRPTQSPGLYYQMIGRGLRRADGKADCLVLDYGGNIERHGPIDLIDPGKPKTGGEPPLKTCPKCQSVILAGRRVCDCGHEFPVAERENKHDARASGASILSEPRKLPCFGWSWRIWKKPGSPDSLRVDYRSGSGDLCGIAVSEWICFGRAGYAGMRAAEWWLRHGGTRAPASAAEALARCAEVRPPAGIEVGPDPSNPKYRRITRRFFQ